MKNILVIIGTRPEAIKLAPVICLLSKLKDLFNVEVCLTGQHSEMLVDAVKDFDIYPNYDLKLMKANQTLFDITALILSNLRKVIETYNPGIILIQGDTTTAFVGALAGYYSHAKICHVEAGLRTYNKFSPFPEEMNRRLISSLADYHFAPTARGKEALLNEGVEESSILVTGNTVIDALFMIRNKVEQLGIVVKGVENVLKNKNQKIVLVTGHRRESFGEGFENICKAIRQLAERFKNVNFIYPVHLNPNVQTPVYSLLKGFSNIYLLPPLSYMHFVRIMDSSYLILTDSGGIQEEAPSLGKPVLVMRDTTERIESIEVGNSILVGTDPVKIVFWVSKLLKDDSFYCSIKPKSNPYGDGKASIRIANFIAEKLR